MLESFVSNKFDYKKLTEAEQTTRGILGRLVGVIADTVEPTRNGRKYSEELWENVFNNPIMQEKIKNRVCFGELGHPADRTETDIEKVAICLAEQPKRGSNGKLYGVFDILSTPNGKILKALCDYGCNIGISSRGQGDLITDDNGDEAVDPDTYDCECFDAVLVPGVETARLKYVREGLETKKTLQSMLKESLNAATENDKRIMVETLNNLNIQLNEAEEVKKKEVNLADCTKLENADIARDVAKELGAKWVFGAEESMGVDAGAKYFNLLTKNMELYVYEAGKDSLCFGIKDDGSIYGPFDIADKPAKDVIINVTLPSAMKEDLNEAKKDEEEEPEVEADEFGELDAEEEVAETEDEVPAEEISDEEVPAEEMIDAEPIEDGEEVVDAEEVVDTDMPAEEEVRSDEEIFLDFLANNFEEDQIKQVADILGIEVTEDGEVNIDVDNAESDEAAEEISDEEIAEEPVEDAADVNKESDEGSDNNIDGDEETEDKAAEDDDEAVDEGLSEILGNLTEALKSKTKLEADVKTLQEKLAVSDAKAVRSEASCKKLQEAVARLSTVAKLKKDLQTKVSQLEEELSLRDETISKLNESIESLNASAAKSTGINESLNNKASGYESEIKALKEELEASKQRSSTDAAALTEKLNKQTSLKEGYKKLANKTVTKYIELQADVLGLAPQEIKRKLGESYTLEDIDQVCEELKKYYFNVSKLPFSADRKIGVRVHESSTQKSAAKSTVCDDDVDDMLMRIANFGR